jgi:hypothetical protein
MPEPRKLLYLIHAADDHALAGLLKEEIQTQIPGWRVFVASKAGDIPTGADWLNQIHDNLRIAASYLLLLTPTSVRRYWVWYEAGAAWRSRDQRLPVVAAGLTRDEIDFPLRAAQTLVLDDPADAAQLFKDLGGHLDSPSSFCARVRGHVSAKKPPASPEQVQIVQQALGATIGQPPKLLLRRMLDVGGLTEPEMSSALKSDPTNYVSDPVSVGRMLDLLKQHGLVVADSEGRWRVKPEIEDSVRRYLSPSPLALQMLQLAAELRNWVHDQTGLIDSNIWEQRFRERVEALREKAKRDHAEVDSWLSKQPGADTAVRQIADALERVARRLP